MRSTPTDVRVLTRVQALALGFSRAHIGYRLRSGHWSAVLPGVYLTTSSPVTKDLLRAALLYAGRAACLSGASALWLYGIRCPKSRRALVLLPRERAPKQVSWAQFRPTQRLPAPQWREGLPLAPPARSVADWALRTADLDSVRATVARGLQGGHCTLGQLESELKNGPRNHSAVLREALAEIGMGARSAPEARAAKIMRRAGLEPFEQNVAVGPYVVDFLWRPLRAVLEIDSVEYHFSPGDWQRTLSRHRELESLGFSVIHVRPSELDDERGFVDAIRRWLVGRGGGS
jgi:very-short-patch-repair endonuclease